MYSPRPGTRVLLTIAALVLLAFSLQRVPAPAAAAAQVLAPPPGANHHAMPMAVALASPLEPPPTCQQFSDVYPSDYYYKGVQYLTCRGAISGYGDGTFRPYNNVTRAQLAKMVILSARTGCESGFSQDFSDVPPGAWFYDCVETAYRYGYMWGYGNGLFGPNDNADRQTIAKAGIRAAGGASGYTLINPATPTFSDVPRSSPYYQFIETGVARNMVSGYSCGPGCPPYFSPTAATTRGQVAKILTDNGFNHTNPYAGSLNYDWQGAGLPSPGLETQPRGYLDISKDPNYTAGVMLHNAVLLTSAAQAWLSTAYNNHDYPGLEIDAERLYSVCPSGYFYNPGGSSLPAVSLATANSTCSQTNRPKQAFLYYDPRSVTANVFYAGNLAFMNQEPSSAYDRYSLYNFTDFEGFAVDQLQQACTTNGSAIDTYKCP